MPQNATPGMNRTGTALALQRLQAMRAGMEELLPTAQGSAQAIAAVKAVPGAQPTLLLDKLGERLACECTGTRLYEGSERTKVRKVS